MRLARKYPAERNLPQTVGCVVSLPAATEEQQICRNAVNAFKVLLKEKVSPLILIDNARIHEA